MPFQLFSHGRRHVDHTGLPRLRQRVVQLPINRLSLPANVEDTACVVKIIKTQPEDLPLPETAPQAKNNSDPVPLINLALSQV